MSITNIYTDGSCLGNPGAGGWAYCIINENGEICISGSEHDTTNNRMEMMAVIEALKSVNTIDCIIHTDSQLVMKCAKNVWKRKKNLDLWSQYNTVSRGKNIDWIWIKAHNGDKYNEMVDNEARKQAMMIK